MRFICDCLANVSSNEVLVPSISFGFQSHVYIPQWYATRCVLSKAKLYYLFLELKLTAASNHSIRLCFLGSRCNVALRNKRKMNSLRLSFLCRHEWRRGVTSAPSHSLCHHAEAPRRDVIAQLCGCEQ